MRRDIIVRDRTCSMCGATFSGTSHAKFCDACRRARASRRSKRQKSARISIHGLELTDREKLALAPYMARRMRANLDPRRDKILYVSPTVDKKGESLLAEHRGMFPAWLARRVQSIRL